MYRVIEKQNSSGTYFEVQIYDSKKTITDSKIIQIISYNTTTDDNDHIVMIYDSNMNPIENAIRFINFGGMVDQSQNYILQAVSALKFLYAYLSIYNIELKIMTKKEAIGGSRSIFWTQKS